MRVERSQLGDVLRFQGACIILLDYTYFRCRFVSVVYMDICGAKGNGTTRVNVGVDALSSGGCRVFFIMGGA